MYICATSRRVRSPRHGQVHARGRASRLSLSAVRVRVAFALVAFLRFGAFAPFLGLF